MKTISFDVFRRNWFSVSQIMGVSVSWDLINVAVLISKSKRYLGWFTNHNKSSLDILLSVYSA